MFDPWLANINDFTVILGRFFVRDKNLKTAPVQEKTHKNAINVTKCFELDRGDSGQIPA
jgi:hypothetical protein